MTADDDKGNPFLERGPRLKEEEIFSGLGPARGSLLFLGRYTLKEVMAVLARKGFFREAKKRNLWPLKYRLDSSDYPVLIPDKQELSEAVTECPSEKFDWHQRLPYPLSIMVIKYPVKHLHIGHGGCFFYLCSASCRPSNLSSS